MAMKKPHPDLKITRGNHLSTCVNSHTGEVKLIWDWDALLKEVQEATSLVAVTEAKVKRTRKKKEV